MTSLGGGSLALALWSCHAERSRSISHLYHCVYRLVIVGAGIAVSLCIDLFLSSAE